jgi:hypothetical protein
MKNVLCSRNKSKLPQRQCVYKISGDCKDSHNNAYIGETCRKVSTRMDEHRGYATRNEGKDADKSGIAQHIVNCPNGKQNFEGTEILATIQGKSRKKIKADLQIREAMEIRLHPTGPYTGGFNEDLGNRVYTTAWDPLFRDIRPDAIKNYKTLKDTIAKVI